MHLYTNTELYDLVHGEIADDEVLSFYLGMAAEYGPKVLDAACGTGFLLIPMAKAGVDICGFDLSDEMLAECRRKADRKGVEINVWLDDMRSFDAGQKFDLIFIAGNSFQHLMTDEDIAAAFNAIRDHLTENGRFVVEIFNPSWPLLMREPEKRLLVGQFGEYILTEDSAYDIEKRLGHTTWHFWHKPTNKEVSLSYNSREYFAEDIRQMFDANAFEIEHHYGEFDLSPYDEHLSSKHLIVARPSF